MAKSLTLVFLALWIMGARLGAVGDETPRGTVRVHDAVLPAGESERVNWVSLGGTLRVDGALYGSILLLGGSLEINGTLEGDVITFLSDLKLGPGARMKGDALIFGGKASRHPHALQEGAWHFSHLELGRLEHMTAQWLSDGSIPLFRFMKMAFWLVATLLLLYFMPRGMLIAETIWNQPRRRVLWAGPQYVLLFALSFLVSALLILIWVGVPLLGFLLLVLLCALLLGKALLFLWVGRRILLLFTLRDFNSVWPLVLGGVLLGGLSFIPVVGLWGSLLLRVLELGAGMMALRKLWRVRMLRRRLSRWA